MRCRWSANTVHNGFAGMYFTFPPPVPPLVEFLLPWGFVFITYRVCLWGSRADSSCGWPYFLVPYTETFSWIQEESSDTVPAFPVASVSTYSNALLFSCMEPVSYTFPSLHGEKQQRCNQESNVFPGTHPADPVMSVRQTCKLCSHLEKGHVPQQAPTPSPPDTRAGPGQKKNRHSLLWDCYSSQLINSLLIALLKVVQLKEDMQCISSLL